MCTAPRWIFNNYTHQKLYVSCGHCLECLQEKSSKIASRLRAVSNQDGYETAFVTLTYDDISIPYIHSDHIVDSDTVDVYSYRPFFRPGCKNTYHYSPTISLSDVSSRCIARLTTNKPVYSLAGVHYLDTSFFDKERKLIGVLLYKDVQDFKKRLRINLVRHYNYDEPLFIYSCGEYGYNEIKPTYRPHFHLLITYKREYRDKIRSAVIESWPFCDPRRFDDQGYQIARDCSRYVSGYIVKSPYLPSFYTCPAFRQKRSYSSFYALSNPSFSASEIAKSLERGTYEYVTTRFDKDLQQQVSTTLPYPKYVSDFFFPRYSGLRNISDNGKYWCAACPAIFIFAAQNMAVSKVIIELQNLYSYFPSLFIEHNIEEFSNVYYSIINSFRELSSPDTHTNKFDVPFPYYRAYLCCRLRLDRWLSSGFNVLDYIHYYKRFLSVRASKLLVRLGNQCDASERYDNIVDCFLPEHYPEKVHADTSFVTELNPQNFKFRIQQNSELRKSAIKHLKQESLTNFYSKYL